jgi:circadian clock protein KaiC
MMSIGESSEVKAMLTRVIDFLKSQGITTVFTSLTGGGQALEQSEVGISSLMDTWLLLRIIESNGERNRILYVLKSRGMAHSNQMREFVLSDKGIQLVDVYLGSGQVLTGAARLVQEAKDQAAAVADQQVLEQHQRDLQNEKVNLRAQAEAIAQKLKSIDSELKIAAQQDTDHRQRSAKERKEISQARSAD